MAGSCELVPMVTFPLLLPAEMSACGLCFCGSAVSSRCTCCVDLAVPSPPCTPGHLPDYACLIVGANMGVVGMCKEHLGVALALKVPVFFVVTKVRAADGRFNRMCLCITATLWMSSIALCYGHPCLLS